MTMELHQATVGLGDRSYQIFVQPGLLNQAAGYLEEYVSGRNCLIITDSRVNALYGARLFDQVEQAGAKAVALADFQDGEGSKHLQTVEKLLHAAVDSGLDRTSRVLALGGGVPGDIAGFVAAIYMRGIDFIQIPTSLLAMVDSSVGGKTGVDMPQGKNLVGAFWQPKRVLIDPELLQTLPKRELKCGLAEIVKHAMILDSELFDLLEQNTDKLNNLDLDFYAEIVARNCGIKADIVARDEREGGVRALLNYGHTFGHALEAVSNYETLGHGEAVSVGMNMAADLAVKLGVMPEADAKRQEELMRALGMPCTVSDIDPNAALAAMSKDKKNQAGKLRFVLCRSIGQADIFPGLESDDILQAIRGRCD